MLMLAMLHHEAQLLMGVGLLLRFSHLREEKDDGGLGALDRRGHNGAQN